MPALTFAPLFPFYWGIKSSENYIHQFLQILHKVRKLPVSPEKLWKHCALPPKSQNGLIQKSSNYWFRKSIHQPQTFSKSGHKQREKQKVAGRKNNVFPTQTSIIQEDTTEKLFIATKMCVLTLSSLLFRVHTLNLSRDLNLS